MTSTITRTDYDCPAWCERTDHHADDMSNGSPPHHYGPTFGIIATMAVVGAEMEVSIDEPIVFLGAGGAAGLRKVAADALAAAEWLEAQA